MDNVIGNITELDTNLLQTNPLQPRGIISPDSLQELVDSIREQGILEPIVVARTPAGYQIIAGERRWRAARILELVKVPVVMNNPLSARPCIAPLKSLIWLGVIDPR